MVEAGIRVRKSSLALEEILHRINLLHSFEMYNNYRQRYIDYAPLGFLEEDSYFFIKENLTNLILDYSRNFS